MLFVIGYLLLAILPVFAADGLVPCSGPVAGRLPACDMCKFLQLISNITLFIVRNITAPLAGLLFLIGGIMMVSAGGSEARLKKGKDIFRDTAIGVLIVLASWAIVNTLITTIGASTSGFVPSNWWSVRCSSTAPATAPANSSASGSGDSPEQLRAQCESSLGSVWRNGQCEYIP